MTQAIATRGLAALTATQSIATAGLLLGATGGSPVLTIGFGVMFGNLVLGAGPTVDVITCGVNLSASSRSQDMAMSGNNPVSIVELDVPRGSQRAYTLTVTELVLSGVTGQLVLQRTDLTGSTIYFTVRNKNTGDVVFTKVSSDPSQIEILPQGSGIATNGQAVIKLTAADTEGLNPADCFEYDVWVVTADNRRDAVIDTSPFNVIERVAVSPV